MEDLTKYPLVLAALAAASLPKLASGECSGSSPSWTAASLSQADVADCIAAASAGDTITLPAGSSAPWTARLEVTRAQLTIQGQGTDGGSGTTINGFGFLLSSDSDGARISGIHFNAGSNTPVIRVSSGTDYGGTPVTGWVIEGNRFTATESGCLSVFNGSTGLVANNEFFIDGATTIYVYGRDDVDWATPPFVGTAGQYVFVEDNRFEATGSASNHVMLASWGGSYVFRCNRVTHDGSSTYKDMIDVHGYGHGTHRRSGRSVEVYGNRLDNDNYSSRTFNFRGGTGRIFANRWLSADTFIGLTDYRMADYGLSMAFPTDTADCGTNGSNCPSDAEATCCADHEGYPCCDQVGRGQDGVGGGRQQDDPFFFWDNQADDLTEIAVVVPDGTPTANIQVSRDYLVGSVPAGYAPYTYPHPDRALAPTSTCLTDGSSEAQTGIVFWTGTAGGAGGVGGSTAAGGSGAGGGGPSSAVGTAGAGPGSSATSAQEDGGCGCRAAGCTGRGARGAVLLLLALVLSRARRRSA